MQILKVNGNDYAIGLSWHNLATKNPKKEAAGKAAEQKSKGLVVRGNGLEAAQFQVGLSSDQKAAGKYSAAAVLADSLKNILLIESLGNEKYWVVAAIDGLVVSGTDRVVGLDKAKNLYKKLFADISRINTEDSEMSPIVAMSRETEKELDVSVEYSYNFAYIVQLNEEGPGKHQKIKSAVDQKKLAVIAVAVISTLGAGYYFTFGQKDPLDDLRRLEELAAQSGPVVEKPKPPSDNELLEKARQEEIEWLTDDFNKRDPKSVVIGFYQFADSLPKQIVGWSVEDISYDAASPETIQVIYVNTGYGSPVLLKEKLQDNLLTVDFSAEKANASFLVDGLVNPAGQNINDISGYLSNSKYGRLELIHDFDAAGLKWAMGETKPKKRREAIQGLSPKLAQESQKKQFVPKTITFTVSSESLEDTAKLPAILEASKTILINTINYKPLKNGAWEINGELYE